MVFPVPKLCESIKAAAPFQARTRRGSRVAKTHRPRAVEAYEGDAGINRENITD